MEQARCRPTKPKRSEAPFNGPNQPSSSSRGVRNREIGHRGNFGRRTFPGKIERCSEDRELPVARGFTAFFAPAFAPVVFQKFRCQADGSPMAEEQPNIGLDDQMPNSFREWLMFALAYSNRSSSNSPQVFSPCPHCEFRRTPSFPSTWPHSRTAS